MTDLTGRKYTFAVKGDRIIGHVQYKVISVFFMALCFMAGL